MEEEERGRTKLTMSTITGTIWYAINGLFMFAGIALLFSGNVFPGLLLILISLLSIPETADKIENRLNVSLSTPVRSIVVICLFLGFIATVNPIEPSGEKEESAAGAQWLEYYSRNSQIIEEDFRNIEEARNEADLVALSNSGSKLYYDSLTAIDERKMIDASGFTTIKAGANDEEFSAGLEHSKEAGSCIVSEVYELKQGRKSQADEYKYQSIVNTNFYHTDTRSIDTNVY